MWLELSTHYTSICFCRCLGLSWSHQLHLPWKKLVKWFLFFKGLHPSLYLLQMLNDFSQLGFPVFWAGLPFSAETRLWREEGDLACVTEQKWIGRTMRVWGTVTMTYSIFWTYYSISIIHSWNKHSISQHSRDVFFHRYTTNTPYFT